MCNIMNNCVDLWTHYLNKYFPKIMTILIINMYKKKNEKTMEEGKSYFIKINNNMCHNFFFVVVFSILSLLNLLTLRFTLYYVPALCDPIIYFY